MLLLNSALISTIISGIFSAIIYFFGVRQTKKEKLEAERNSIIKISIEYPYLEYPDFCNGWDKEKVNRKDSEAEKYIRYEAYSILLFNHLEDVCRYYKYDIERIKRDHVDIKNWLRLHRKIWKSPLSGEHENTNGYEKEFVSFVDEIVR